MYDGPSLEELAARAAESSATGSQRKRGKIAVVAGMLGNIAVGVVKFIAAAISGSAAMLSEGIHSLVDACNDSLLLIGTFFFLNIMTQSVVDSVEQKVNITAYVSDEATDVDINSMMDFVRGLENVSEVSFTNKEQALENFKASMESNMDIVEQLDGENPLPRSIDVELTDPQQVETVAQQIIDNETFAAICDNPDDPSDSVMYGQRSVEKLFSVTNVIRYAGIAAVILLIFVTLIFINNTIRLSIMNRRREIGIMRLVGASNGFIRGPFLMEGVIQAIIGAALATGCIAALRAFLLPRIADALPWLPITLDGSMYVQIYIIFFVAAIVVGLFGSALAMRRYLKI